MWRRVVSSSSAQLQTLALAPCRPSRPFLICASSSLTVAPFQGSFTLCSFHAFFTSSSSSAFATSQEHEEVESELEGRNTTSKQSATYSGYYGQNNGQWQQNLNVVYAGSSRGSQQSSNKFSLNYSGYFGGSTCNEFLNKPVQQSGKFSRYYGHENGGLQQTTKQDCTHLEDGSIQQNPYVSHQEGPREVRQIPDGFNSQSSSGSQGSINHSFMQNSAKY